MIEVVLDTETTGLSIKEGHRIVEIGCLELDNLIPTKNVFHCFLNPEKKVSESAFKVHGYSDDFLANKPKFKDVVKKFLKFIDKKRLIIHNSEFDLSHLNNELSLIGFDKISSINVVDTMEIAKNKFPGSSVSLDALCKRYKIDNSKREKHNAIIDCELLSKVYVNLLGQREPTLDLSTSQTYDLNISSSSSNQNYSKKIINLTDEEIRSHKKYLKAKQNKNFFN